MQKSITLIKGDKVGAETDYRDYLPVNMTAVLRPILKANGYMVQHPGLVQYATGQGIDRGGIYNERQTEHYRISLGSLISVSANGATNVLGAISGKKNAALPYSFNSQAIITDGRMWLYTGTLNEITDTDLGNPIDGVWVDNVYLLTDGEYLFHTDLADETSIDPLKFATSEFSPDPTLGVGKTPDNKVIVFNRYSTEFFVNTANENFAFTRIATRAVKLGVVGTFCKTELLDRWVVMGGRKEEAVSIHYIGVGSAQKIGTRETDKIIGQYTEPELSECTLETRVEDGYQYIIVHLPNEVLLYNHKIAENIGLEYAWTIVKTDVQGTKPWRAIHGVFEPRKGVWVYGDKLDSNIGILDENVVTHYGEIAEWELRTPLMHLESMSINELELETIPGFTVDADSTVATSVTFDGFTYSKEFWELYGNPSDYQRRFILRALGYVNDKIGFKFRGATKSKMAFGIAKIDFS